MDAVENFLLYVVAFSVFVVLIMEFFDSCEKRSKYCCVGDGIKRELEGLISVGGEGEEKVRDDFGAELGKEAERGIPERIGSLELGSGSANSEGEGGIGDDWVGIERTELEKMFGEAVVFVSRHDNVDQIADVKLELYGLQQVALEGSCHGSQPMALNIPARLKWNAWQKLGHMSQEAAMETYIDILSKAIPEWQVDKNCTTLQDQDQIFSTANVSSMFLELHNEDMQHFSIVQGKDRQVIPDSDAADNQTPANMDS